MIKSGETLEYSRAYLRAHTNFPVPATETPLFCSHARIATTSDDTDGFAFFGRITDPRSSEVDSVGKIDWNTQNRNLNAWFWTPDTQFNGLYLSGAFDHFAPDKKFPSEKFNGFHVESTDRSTTLAIGNISVADSGVIEMSEIEIGMMDADSDRLVSKHFDYIVGNKMVKLLSLAALK